MKDCSECEWCKSLRDSEGDRIWFCMNANGGNYLGVTGLCGFCDLCDQEGEEEEQ